MLCQHIEDIGYYKFGAQEPARALAIELSRRSINVDIGHSNPDKLFYRSAPAAYGLIEWLESSRQDEGQGAKEIEEDVAVIVRSREVATVKEQLILARIGQGSFRSNVLALWDERCAITGSALAVRASHIKPWRHCSNVERLDPKNGLPLVATLDALFDAHLISFDAHGCIMLSNKIPRHDRRCLGINGSMMLRRRSVPTATDVHRGIRTGICRNTARYYADP